MHGETQKKEAHGTNSEISKPIGDRNFPIHLIRLFFWVTMFFIKNTFSDIFQIKNVSVLNDLNNSPTPFLDFKYCSRIYFSIIVCFQKRDSCFLAGSQKKSNIGDRKIWFYYFLGS